MKKLRILAVITAVAMLFTSCDMFNLGTGVEKIQFKAYTEPQSRTTLGDDSKVLWSEGDEIAVVGIASQSDAEGKVFTLVSGAGTTEGVFEGELSKEFPAVYALYPSYMYKSIYTNGYYVLELPSQTIYTEKNFVDGVNPMVAYGTQQTGLMFKNICGIIEFQVKGEGTVSYIQIEANNQALSGTIAVNPVTMEIMDVGEDMYTQITAMLEEPLVLSQTEAKSIYAVVPPQVYEGITVRTIDQNGVVTSRTTTDNIVVERSKITPVSSFQHSDVAEAPAIKLEYNEEASDFAAMRLSMILNSSAAGAYYFITNEERYNEAIASGKTDLQIASEGTEITESVINGRLYAFNYADSKAHVLAVAYDKEGNLNDHAEHLVITPKTDVPESDALTARVENEELDTTNGNTMKLMISTQGASQPAVLQYFYCTEEEYNALSATKKAVYSAVGYSGGRNIDNTSAVIVDLLTLAPGTTYKFMYRVACGEITANGTYPYYSQMYEHTFTIPEYSTSDVEVQLSMSEVKDWSAVVNLSSTKAVKYKLLYTTETIDEGYEYQVNDYGTEIDGSQTTYKLSGLKEQTTYNVYVLGYNAEGVYGKMASTSFTTKDIMAEPNAEYDKFLGEYTFSSKNGCYNNDERPVTITKGVDGKTFYVKGLMNPVAKENFGITDDTMVAKFDASTNAISLGGQIADQGNLPYPIYTCLYSGYYILQNARLSATYNNGELVFGYSYADVGFTGLVFYSSVDGYQGSAGSTNCDFYTDLVLRKAGQGGSGDSNSTEDFGRNDETNVNWQ